MSRHDIGFDWALGANGAPVGGCALPPGVNPLNLSRRKARPLKSPVRHAVTLVPAGGFVWREKTYPSLSAIAGIITGCNWNGQRLAAADFPCIFPVIGDFRASPISYTVDGKQFVAISAGNTLYAFGLAN